MAAIEPDSGMSILDHCAKETDEISLERYGASVIVAWTSYQAQLLGGVAESVAEAAYAAKLRAAWYKYRSVVEPLIADEALTGGP
jgi:hypothetical protein